MSSGQTICIYCITYIIDLVNFNSFSIIHLLTMFLNHIQTHVSHHWTLTICQLTEYSLKFWLRPWISMQPNLVNHTPLWAKLFCISVRDITFLNVKVKLILKLCDLAYLWPNGPSTPTLQTRHKLLLKWNLQCQTKRLKVNTQRTQIWLILFFLFYHLVVITIPTSFSFGFDLALYFYSLISCVTLIPNPGLTIT